MKKSIAVGVLCVLVWATPSWALEFQIECVEGCLARRQCGDDRTPHLICQADDETGVSLRWSANVPPPEGTEIRAYAGNPAVQDSLADRGTLVFEEAEGRWAATRSFSAEELGKGTFIVVTTSRRRSAESLLEWKPYRLLTPAEKERELQGASAGSAWSVDIAPALLQVSAGHGELPRSRGGDKKVWWSLVDLEGDVTDADLDGEHNGVPGLGVHRSTPWPARSGWKEELLGKLGAPEGHAVSFGELEWYELPERELDLGGTDEAVLLRNYYTLVTLFTNASVKVLSGADVGRRTMRRYFSHETSANVKPPSDPRFWSSYSLREYGADHRLLKLLNDHVKRHGSVRGLGGVHRQEGDGGSVVYRVGLTVRVQPWETQEAPDRQFQAGFVGIDVVAARAGFGGVVTPGSAGEREGIAGALCQVLPCSPDGGIDLDNPPRGYRVAQPVASLATLSGGLAMVEGVPALAQRGPDGEPVDDGLPDLPAETRFALGANLRAGAVIRMGGVFGTRVEEIVPVNSYAQFVVKMTVAMVPEGIVDNQEMIAPAPEEVDVVTALPEPRGFFVRLAGWIGDNIRLLLVTVVVAGLVALFIFVPGARELLSAVFRLFATLVERITSLLRGSGGSR